MGGAGNPQSSDEMAAAAHAVGGAGRAFRAPLLRGSPDACALPVQRWRA
ncbi:hypothetical protein C7S14_8112 [Burkholderia cepacia]|nr:hypothetical protein C7S14_8112 [Burkholderia cepacia]